MPQERFFQTQAPALDRNSGPMGTGFLFSIGPGFGVLIARAGFFPVPALVTNKSPTNLAPPCTAKEGSLRMASSRSV